MKAQHFIIQSDRKLNLFAMAFLLNFFLINRLKTQTHDLFSFSNSDFFSKMIKNKKECSCEDYQLVAKKEYELRLKSISDSVKITILKSNFKTKRKAIKQNSLFSISIFFRNNKKLTKKVPKIRFLKQDKLSLCPTW